MEEGVRNVTDFQIMELLLAPLVTEIDEKKVGEKGHHETESGLSFSFLPPFLPVCITRLQIGSFSGKTGEV